MLRKNLTLLLTAITLLSGTGKDLVDDPLFHTTLDTGDLFFTSVNSDGDDNFSFVLLVDISGTTTVYFTDNGWNPSADSFLNTSEGTLTWTFTGNLSAGTEVSITESNNSTNIAASSGSISRSGSFSLSGTGDVLFAYVGSSGSPSKFIAGFNTRGNGWPANPTVSSVESGLPADLEDGKNAIGVTSHADDWVYDCSVSTADKATLLAALANIDKWTGGESVNAAPNCGVTIGSAAPTSATVAATAFLEGAYNGSSLNTTINGSIPSTQPYSGATYNNHAGTESASAPAGAVDWVLVELREAGSAAAALNSTKVGSVAGFLMSDGSIKATDGTSNLTVSLSGNTGSDFFVVVYHRNHLPIMSAAAVSESSGAYTIDFTSSSANTYQNTTALASLSGSKFGMPAGDLDQDGDIDATDLSTWRSNNGTAFSYGSNGAADFNLDGVINAVDRNEFHQKNTSKTRRVPSS